MADNKHQFTNRLISEKSPYLLQHAHNPVDWFPWGEEAFQLAHIQDKPIFLSIGYATCHWCHVMEKESFESEQIASLMNDAFVNIKVDREEMPELDRIYMEFAQSMMAGAAGWPLNVILTPNLEPFFATTYLPAEESHGLMGLVQLIQHIKEIWNSEERDKILVQASKIVELFAESDNPEVEELPDREQIEETADLLFKMADPVYGGLKGAPKFPIGYQINFFLAYSAKTRESRSIFLAERTLEMMQRGGIYDHIGGGFSRYSVDEFWLIPHFEKMLYDNALLAYSYLEGYLITENPIYQQVCEETIEYILRDMTHPEGGFYSAQDSDSEGHEGRFYTWTIEEIRQILGMEESHLFCEFYGVNEIGNFEGRNVLHNPLSLKEFAEIRGINPSSLSEKFALQCKVLWKARELKEHPFKDDKVLTSWNGLMVHALACTSVGFNEPGYLHAAQRAVMFIRNNLWKNGKLFHRWRDGDAMYNAGLDDYAFLIRALLSLFEADGDSRWLSWALECTTILHDDFKVENGAFYQTDGKDENIILRKCQYTDGAEPSGNAIHCENLLRLYQMSSNATFLDQAEDILKSVKKYFDAYAPGYVYHVMNLLRFYDKRSPTFVIALNSSGDLKKEIATLIFSKYILHKAVVWRNENDQLLFESLPFIKEQKPLEGKTTLYICHEGVCNQPLTDFEQMKQAIQKL